MDRDLLASWLRSVEEAKRHQTVFRQSLGKITRYFKPKQKPNIPPMSSRLTASTELSDSESASIDRLSVMSLLKIMMMILLLCLAIWIQVDCYIE
jgi:hypothetical protein